METIAGTVCASCAKPAEEGVVALKACSRCKTVYYCGSDCQKNHWKAHKAECKKNSTSSSSASSSEEAGQVDPRSLKAWAHVDAKERPKRALSNGLSEQLLADLDPRLRGNIAAEFALIQERACAPDRDSGALYDVFAGCMPPAVKMNLIKNEDSALVSMTGEAQWLYTVMHAWACAYNDSKQAGEDGIEYRRRYLFLYDDEMLQIDVKAVLTCPEDGSVPHGPATLRTDLDSMIPKGKNRTEAEVLKYEGFMKGERVRVEGLAARPDLNGKWGRVRAVNHETLRYTVQLDDGLGSFNVKHANLAYVRDSQYAADAPLLLVRYLYQPKGALEAAKAGDCSGIAEKRHVDATLHDGWLGTAEAAKRQGPVTKAESAQDLRAGVAELRKHEALLSPAYKRHFGSLSPHHHRGTTADDPRRGARGCRPPARFLRPSFLVPPARVAAVNRLDKDSYRCCNPSCGAETADVKSFTNCSRCLSALYCSKACQKAHWKTHKRVCGKCADELEQQEQQEQQQQQQFADDDATARVRASFVMAIDCCPEGLRRERPGWIRETVKAQRLQQMAETGEPLVQFSTNLNHSHKYKEVSVTEDVPMYKNVHGDREFVVKVQVPTGRGSGAGAQFVDEMGLPMRCMLYDRRKTFGDQFFDCDSAARSRAAEMVRAGGVAGGLKGYFMARRQGANVRVYTDRLLPVPTPAW